MSTRTHAELSPVSLPAGAHADEARPPGRWGPKPVVSPAEVAAQLPDDATVLVGGSGGGLQEPGALLEAVSERFRAENAPRRLTLWHCSGVGDREETGMNLLAHEGLVKRVVGGHWGMGPKMAALAEQERIEAYNLPQGVISQLLREVGGRRPGLVTTTGLGTFVDPRLEGGRLNAVTTEDLVEVVELGGSEHLFYRAPRFDVALLRATAADEYGNLSFHEEAALLEAFSVAQAVQACGGKVHVQVKYLVEAHSLHPHRVKVPGSLVDTISVVPEQPQTARQYFQPGFTGQSRVPITSLPVLPSGPRRIVAERAVEEIAPGSVVNLGVGMPDGIAQVAAERGMLRDLAFAVEQGHIGGSPAGGVEFGAVYNATSSIDAGYQFDYFDGGGLDIAFLGMAEVDRFGNVNASRPRGTISGAGGFINISQGTRRVVFCGAFTAVGASFDVGDGVLAVRSEGRIRKFVRDVIQITFSAERARQLGQEVLYITERAVFRLGEDGLELIEVAPGIDVHAEVLDLMDFTPQVADPALMDPRFFHTHHRHQHE
ncbi:acyl CoA:acetate/3-ketoacid CoA transferase [Bogoriella caseilytica]|uniref:Propionate CoA-transferase n=1 Tax=Bogoriella caseilytica TaxID=56055 RepID=A0A3N2BD37_9MICO|nr:CoA-transferase [Bogoriella caseilytica]ROR73158.1 propionate CoA-transferase [Bogoriella caseilytica]